MSRTITSTCESNETIAPRDEPGCSIDDLLLEIVRIREKACNALMAQHGLTLRQMKALTLRDVRLHARTLAVASADTPGPVHVTISADTAASLAAYLRVRPPTEANSFFIIGDDRAAHPVTGMVDECDQPYRHKEDMVCSQTRYAPSQTSGST